MLHVLKVSQSKVSFLCPWCCVISCSDWAFVCSGSYLENNSEHTFPSESSVSSGAEDVVSPPTCSLSAVIATLMGMAGRNMSRQSGWLQPLPPKTLSPADRRTSTLCYCWPLLRHLLNLRHLINDHITRTHTHVSAVQVLNFWPASNAAPRQTYIEYSVILL